ncbi:MAG: DUF3365 domain-containing protein [Vicinamibacterales bacterium]
MRVRCLLLTLVLAATALSAQHAVWPIRDAPADLRPVIARADLMIAEMHDSVLRELNDAFASVGADKAMSSCHIDSILITQRLGREGIAAGRTSDRLRNSRHAPRPWAAALVHANAGRQARDVEGFAVDLGDRLGVLRPIAERPMCATCHGPADRLSPAIRAQIAERYPADKAVGFKEGEIRGWFWVEIPKRPR